MPKGPESYIDQPRPELLDAIKAEGDVPVREAMDTLERKGYFTANPRPWQLSIHDRGLRRMDWVILDRFGGFVAEIPERANANLIIAAVNSHKGDG